MNGSVKSDGVRVSRTRLPAAGAGLRSGDVAAAAGVNPQTLRYYERRGLLPDPDRTLGGHRLYPVEAVTIVRTIKAVQRLGFTLDEAAQLIDGTRHRHHQSPGADVPGRVADKLGEVETKIRDLGVIRDALRSALEAGCEDIETCTQTPDCPLSFARDH